MSHHFLKGILPRIVLAIVAFLPFALFGERPSAYEVSAIIVALLSLEALPWIMGTRPVWQGGKLDVITPENLEKVSVTLRKLVKESWDQEYQLHKLDFPGPMPVPILETRKIDVPDLQLSDGYSESPESDFVTESEPLIAAADSLGDLVEKYMDLPSRRMVILGGEGSGKTIVATLLLRELLKSDSDSDPVPVLLSLDGWNPYGLEKSSESLDVVVGDAGEEFKDWLARRIGDLYPDLIDLLGSNGPAELIRNGRILPIVDGLDELPPDHVPSAVRALDLSLGRGDPLILTLRDDENYVEALRHYADFLNDALVVETLPLTTEGITSYLRKFKELRNDQWDRLLQALDSGTAPTLSEALSSPLATWLLYKSYTANDNSPTELLGENFPASQDVRDHLLDHLIEGALTTDRSRRSQHRVSRPHSAAQTRHYLQFFGSSLDENNDFKWWRIGVRDGLAHRLLEWLRPEHSRVVDFRWFRKATGHSLDRYAPGSVQIKGRLATVFSALASFAFRFLLLITMLAVMGASTSFFVDDHPLSGQPILGAAVGALIAVYAGISISGAVVVDAVTLPLESTPARSPKRTLQEDIKLAALRVACCSLTCLGSSLMFGIQLSLALWMGILLAVSVTMHSACGRYFAVTSILALKGQFPWRVMKFLESVNRLGILRQVGPSYQFSQVVMKSRYLHEERFQPGGR